MGPRAIEREITMRTRRFLAAAVVAALPLVVGALHAPPPRSAAADTQPAHHVAEGPGGPRWLYAHGTDYGTAWLLSGAYSSSLMTRFAIAM